MGIDVGVKSWGKNGYEIGIGKMSMGMGIDMGIGSTRSILAPH